MMRLIIALLLTSLYSSATCSAQGLIGDDLQFPYEALVLREGAPIRSGPDSVHYATDNLSAGTLVEVYRHDPGGWCAIRPPAGSFSLVPESAIEIVDENVGRVITGSAQAWVGTRLGVVEKPLWQIRLKENELVEILGEASWPNPEGHSTIWYQISPPAGEFRWIPISDLQLPDDSTNLPSLAQPQSMTPLNNGIDPLSPAINPNANQSLNSRIIGDIDLLGPAIIATTQTSIGTANSMRPELDEATANPENSLLHSNSGVLTNQILDANVRPAILQESQKDTLPDTPAKSINSGWRPASRKMNRDSSIGKHISNQPPNQFTAPAIPSLESSNNAGPDSGLPASATRVASADMDYNPAIQRAPSTAEATRLPANSPSSNSVSEYESSPIFSKSTRLNQLEMTLTNELLKQPVNWQLDDLFLQTEATINSATDPTVTQHGNRLLAKIRKCQEIRSQYRTAYNDNSMANVGVDGVLRGAVGTGVDTEVEFGATYDAFGWLRELARDSGSTKSTYVLQDDNGKITHHVSGSPGLNLHRYLEQKIGVIGQRGYHQRLGLDHVTAERIVELPQRRY